MYTESTEKAKEERTNKRTRVRWGRPVDWPTKGTMRVRRAFGVHFLKLNLGKRWYRY